MIRTVFLLFLFLLAVSCTAGQPTLPPLVDTREQQTVACPSLFPQGSYRFDHLIEFSMPGGSRGTAMGVTVIDGSSIESVLMTVEGFVLFSARFARTLTVNRAVPPFDRPGFAEGMMEDIRALFERPRGRSISGSTKEHNLLCRVTEDNKETTDIIATADNCLQLNTYAADGLLRRTITGRDCTTRLTGVALANSLQLASKEMGGYTLNMTLLHAEEIKRGVKAQ